MTGVEMNISMEEIAAGIQKPTSQLLLEMVNGAQADARVSLHDVLETLGNRAFGAILLLLGLATSIPSLPFVPTILGILIIGIGVQMVMMRQAPWLPHFLAHRQIKFSQLQGLVRRCAPWLEKIEQVCRPRLSFVTSRGGEVFIGGCLLVLGIVLIPYVPALHIPIGLCILLVALGMIERDGVVCAVGLVSGLGIAVLETVVILRAADKVFHWILG